MKQIQKKKSLLTHLKNAEHFNLHEEIITYTKERILPFDELRSVFDIYTNHFAWEDEEFKHFTRLPGTKQIELLEKQRSETVSHIRKTNDYMGISPDEEESKASAIVADVLYLYNRAGRAAYTENSALITNMIDDLRKPEYASQVALLGLNPLIDKLEKENEEFKAIYLKRTVDNNQIRLRQARQGTDESFYKLADSINALYVTAGLDDGALQRQLLLGELIDAINNIIRNAERIYARRVPSYVIRDNGDDEEEEGEPNPQPYTFDIATQKIENDYEMILIDKNPEAFDAEFAEVPLDGAKLYMDASEMAEGTFYTFKNYIYDENGQAAGMLIASDRLLLDQLPDNPTGNAVLAIDSEIIIRFKGMTIPIVLG